MSNVEYLFKNSKFEILKYFLAIFGSIWLCIECPSFLCKPFEDLVKPSGGLILLVSILISLCISIIICSPKKEITKYFKGSNTTVCIKVGDLLSEEGNIVIGSSDYFDTNYDINSNISLKSQVINKLFSSDIDNVDKLILESLVHQSADYKYDYEKKTGKKNKYPIGTLAIIPNQARKIYILVISQIMYNKLGQKTTVADINILQTALYSLWKQYDFDGRKKEFSLPVFCSGLASISLSHSLLIQTIIMSYVCFAKHTRISERINIVVSPNNYNPKEFHELFKFIDSIEI